MKALTVWNPWAWSIAWGFKPVENRTWKPPASLLGSWIAIHAGKTIDRDRRSIESWSAMLDETLRCQPELAPRVPKPLTLAMMPASAIVAVARLGRIVEESDDPWFVGPFGWWFDEVVRIEPVPCRGAQGLWKVPPDVLLLVHRAFGAARRAA